LSVAAACVLAAVGCLAWGLLSQSRADAQQEAAARVDGVVVAHPDDITIMVRLPGDPARTVAIWVLASATYPVGKGVPLYVDDRGLHQPVSQPYDATGWIGFAVVLVGLGVAV